VRTSDEVKDGYNEGRSQDGSFGGEHAGRKTEPDVVDHKQEWEGEERVIFPTIS